MSRDAKARVTEQVADSTPARPRRLQGYATRTRKSTATRHACLKNLRHSQFRNTATTVVGTVSGRRTAV